MSKLSHNKAVARHRRVKHGRCHHYTKKEMKALMPQFSGQSVDHYKAVTVEIPIGTMTFKVVLDKNHQICDCTRIGNIFSQLSGRVLTEELNIIERVHNELDNISNN